MTNCRQFRLLFPLLFIGQVVHSEVGEGMRKIDILARYNFKFIREHDNLVQYLSKSTSIL